MIHIFSAIECEASAFRHLVSDDLEIVITGIGKINAAFAVGRTFPNGLSRNDLKNDVVINIGTCGSKDHHGIFLVNKITDEATGRDYYPDVIRVSGLNEACLITSDNIVTDPAPGFLYDMEASAVFHAASRLISPDRIIFLKMVSDSGDAESVTKDDVIRLTESHIDTIESVIEQVRNGIGISYPSVNEKIYERLHATSSMKVQIDELIDFAASLGIDGITLFDEAEAGADLLTKNGAKEVIARVRDILTHLC